MASSVGIPDPDNSVDALVRWLIQRHAPPRNGRRRPRRAARLRGATRTHKDVEFAVDHPRGEEHIFKTFDEAVGFAAGVALSTGTRIELDVLVMTRAGAEWWGGSDGAEAYEDDPDASVFDRLIVNVSSQGRVP